jgi:arylsulfatase A
MNKLIVLVVFLAVGGIQVAECSDWSRRPAGGKPNVILIMADDVSWEAFGCYGGEDYRTPHIDALAASGVRFAHCYSTPICTTSRVKLMTGQYNFRNYTHFGYLNPEERTFGHLLQDAGYKTAIAGKWQLNGLANNLPGNQDGSRPQQAGFHESYLWQVTTARKRNGRGGERFWSPPLEHNGRYVSVEENHGKYGPDILCDFVCDFVDRHQDEPFFVYYPMMLVHNPFVATPDTIGDAPRTQAANKAPKGKAAQKKNFVAMVEYMDKIVGRIVAKVKEVGQLENTIIMFTADNGTNTSITSRWNGQDIQGGKGGLTDMGTHVPLVVSWPGTAPAGVVLNDLIEFTDFYPTLANAAGVGGQPNEPIDGVSFLPQLQGKSGTSRPWVLCHYQPYWNKVPGQFVRTQQFKLYHDGRFYHVPVDLREQHPLAVGSEAEDTRLMLQRLLDQCPSAPTERATKETVSRPIYPDWMNLVEAFD